MKRIILWGFTKEMAEAVENVKSIELIECFHSRAKFNHCKIDIDEYKPYDKDVYDKVYKSLPRYFVSRNRPKQMYLKCDKFYDYVDFFNIYFQYFYNLIKNEKPDAVFFDDIPHLGPDIIFFEIAKAIGIKTVILAQSLFPNRLMYCDSVENLGNAKHMMKLNDDEFIIEKKYKKDLFYMRKKFPTIGILKNIRSLNRAYLTIINILKFPYTIAYNIRINKHISKNIDLTKNFVYFPLHLQPEMTTDSLGGIYRDQMLAIERTAELLPKDWFVYVKENPYQDEFRRGRCFFQRLRMLKNVKLVPPNTSTYDLIEKSKFVATITGTAGWESISGGKNVLVFGQAWYKYLPGVFEYSKDFKLDDILNYKINHTELQLKFNKLYQSMGTCVVSKSYRKIIKNFDSTKNLSELAKLIAKLTNDWNPQSWA